MNEKLIENVEVRTFMQRLRCPNLECQGLLEFDNKERTKDGLHGGEPEYRHRCDKCQAGYWVKEKYPKLKYELVESSIPAREEYVQQRNVPKIRTNKITRED